MRRILVATLLSSFALTAAAATPNPAHDAAVDSARPVSTGVTGPQLYYSTRINIPADQIPTTLPAKVGLKVSLDATGSPTNIQIVQPLTDAVDARVVEAVRQFRWRPAVLDNQTIPVDMNLTVQLQQ